MRLGKVGIVVAARTGSRRLPGKALLPLRGIPMVAFLLRRLEAARRAMLVFATTELSADDTLASVVAQERVPVYRGANEDVVARYVAAAERFGLDTVVRVTADCPFVSAELVDYCLDCAAGLDGFDLVTTKTRFPVGLDAEIYRADSMMALHGGGQLTPVEREHLTLHYYNQSDAYDVRYLDPPPPWVLAGTHFTIDTDADYARASRIAAALPDGDISVAAVVQAARRHLPEDSKSTGHEER
jgi:spore coat polysaccharide biosynthesis protein SpsF